jgi:hypothetical protein
MRRLTRRIGLFGGPAAMISQSGVIKKPSVNASGATPAAEPEKAAEPAPPAAPARKKGWLSRLFGSGDDPS